MFSSIHYPVAEAARLFVIVAVYARDGLLDGFFFLIITDRSRSSKLKLPVSCVRARVSLGFEGRKLLYPFY